MKNKVLYGLTLAVVALLGSMDAHQASAFEMNTEVKNISGTTADIEVYGKSSTGTATRYSTFSIANGETKLVTFLSLTGTCPSYITGKVGNTPIQQMSCSGVESSSTTGRCCANLKFNVIKNQDGTYHFKKISS